MLMLCLHLSSLSPSVCFSTALSSPPHPLFVKAPFCFSLLYFFQNHDEHEQGSAHRNGDRYSVKYARVWFGAEMLQT